MGKSDGFEFKLGVKLRDEVTGFIGVATSRTQWLHNCNTYGLQPTKLKDGKPQDRQHFDEPELSLVEEKPVVKESVKKTGGPERPIPSTKR